MLKYKTSFKKSQAHRVTELILRNLMIQTSITNSNNQKTISPDPESYLSDMITNMKQNKEIEALTHIHNILTNIIDKVPKSDAHRIDKHNYIKTMGTKVSLSKYEWRDMNMELAWNRTSLIMKYEGKLYLFPRQYLLMIHNKVSDLLSVLVLASTYPDQHYNAPCLNYTLQFVREFIKLALKYEDKFFSISKVLEAIVIGETLIRTEGNSNKAFLDNVCRELYESTEYDYLNSELRNIMDQCSIPLMHELACLSKILGHPFCDMEETARDLEEKTHEERLITAILMTQAVRYAKKDFVTHYILKENKWPKVTVTREIPALQAAIASNKDPSSSSHQRAHGAVKLEDWDHIEFHPIKEFDRVENILPHIKDRTISLMKSKVIERYFDNQPPDKDDWINTRRLHHVNSLGILNFRILGWHVKVGLKDRGLNRTQIVQ